MKEYVVVSIALLFCFLCINIPLATADTWTQRADFGGAAQDFSVAFSIGSKGYMGVGSSGPERISGSTTYPEYVDPEG